MVSLIRGLLYRLRKNVPRFVEIIACIEQAIDLRVVARPFLDFVEVAHVGDPSASSVSSLDQSSVIPSKTSSRASLVRCLDFAVPAIKKSSCTRTERLALAAGQKLVAPANRNLARKFAVMFRGMSQALPNAGPGSLRRDHVCSPARARKAKSIYKGAHFRYIHAASTALKCLFRKRIQWLLRSQLQRLRGSLVWAALFVEASNGRRTLAKGPGAKKLCGPRARAITLANLHLSFEVCLSPANAGH
jgi:hypothetical protein